MFRGDGQYFDLCHLFGPLPVGRPHAVRAGVPAAYDYHLLAERGDGLETAAVFTEDGYLKTGDLGYMDSEDYLYLTGRAKNMIVTEGGKNVYPEEIENEFQLFEEIEQILVRGFVIDKKMKTEGIEALVYPSPDVFKGKSAEEIKPRIDAIISEVNQRLLPYQKIEKITLLDERMEETTTKKIKRDAV